MCLGPRMAARREILLPVSWVGVSRGRGDGGGEGEGRYGFDVFASGGGFGWHLILVLGLLECYLFILSVLVLDIDNGMESGSGWCMKLMSTAKVRRNDALGESGRQRSMVLPS